MCSRKTNVSRIKVEENGRKATFLNEIQHEYVVSVIDGCLIREGERADYLVSKKNVASAIVELKGKDVEHACSQLFSSASNEVVNKLIEKKFGFLVVCSKYPRFDTFVIRAKQRAMKQFKAGFHVVAKNIEYDIERVAAIDGPV